MSALPSLSLPTLALGILVHPTLTPPPVFREPGLLTIIPSTLKTQKSWHELEQPLAPTVWAGAGTAK